MNYALSTPLPTPVPKLPRVILADDQPAYLTEMVELLRGAGYDCQCVPDGQECERELLRGDVDVLVADIRMPGNMNLELAARVRSMPNPPAIILMTGFPTLESAISSVKLKISAYLVKPFGFNELLNEVQQALNARRSPSSPPGPRARGLERRQDPGSPVPQAVEGLLRNPEAQKLTRREFEVLVRVLMGDDVPAIGSVLFISPHTVRNHLKAIYRKLDVRSRVELVVRFGPIQRAASGPHSLS